MKTASLTLILLAIASIIIGIVFSVKGNNDGILIGLIMFYGNLILSKLFHNKD